VALDGVKVISVPENRWDRCNIKSVSLLPNVLAKQAAKEAGAFEAWFTEADGTVTEGSSSNAWIVDNEGSLVTRDLNHSILAGITRARIIELANNLQIKVKERPFSLEEAKIAQEVFITSTTAFILPVSSIDNVVIGDGKPGSVAMRLRELYAEYIACHSEQS
jgi:D-alanine transaminase